MYYPMSASQEDRPLLSSLSEASVSRLWFGFGVGALVVAWCVFDSWNHDTISGIFEQKVVKLEVPNALTGGTWAEHQDFNYTLTLAFIQFVFLGLGFCFVFVANVAATGGSVTSNLANLRPTLSSGRLPLLGGTHMLGSLLLQSLMMPTQMMSLALFAASRAVEIPVAAVARAKVSGARFGRHEPLTVGLAFVAAWMLFYSYTQIAECMCVWSGFGVALTGAPLYIVYALLLTIPPTTMVLQESMLIQHDVNLFLMQGVQNLCAAMIFLPILISAHYFGHENVQDALLMITGNRKIYMSVIWLCLQAAVLSAITVALILTVDSFWAVAARSLRVVFWWVRQLPYFYLTSNTLLSVSRPHASLWSFVMVCGICLGMAAVIKDRRQNLEDADQAKLSGALPDRAKGLGMGRYV